MRGGCLLWLPKSFLPGICLFLWVPLVKGSGSALERPAHIISAAIDLASPGPPDGTGPVLLALRVESMAWSAAWFSSYSGGC